MLSMVQTESSLPILSYKGLLNHYCLLLFVVECPLPDSPILPSLCLSLCLSQGVRG